MMEYLALRSGVKLLIDRKEPIRSLKQQALFFDKIGILNLEDCLEYDLDIPSKQIQELQWLTEKGLIYNINDNLEGLPHTKTTRALSQLGLISSARISQLKEDIYKADSSAMMEWDFATSMFETVYLRLLAVKIEISGEANAVPLISFSKYLHIPVETKKTDVIKVSVKKLPTPDENTPWEKILEYRNDTEAQNNLLALRRWIRQFGKEDLSAGEIEEELEVLINEYQKYMALHKIKSTTSIWESIIKVSLEAMENIATLKFSKLADILFTAKKQKIDLMEAEINAPNKEIAYLVKTNEEFNK